MPSHAGALAVPDTDPPPIALTPITLTPPPSDLGRAALFLDLDGVLAPTAPTPDGVRPSARRTDVLTRLVERLDGRLAVVSGRTISEIDRICEGAVACVSGIHGLERRRADGSVERAEAATGIEAALASLRDFAAAHPGVLIEDKGVAVGLHYRQAPEAAQAALALARDLAVSHHLSLQPGHMIAELKTPGSDKGRAVAAFMDEPPFRGSTPVMAGDDQTDEFGFVVARALGGFGVLVGPARATAAVHGLADSDAVLAWLDAFAPDEAAR